MALESLCCSDIDIYSWFPLLDRSDLCIDQAGSGEHLSLFFFLFVCGLELSPVHVFMCLCFESLPDLF
ncbi:hypothetical protein BDA96_10G002800 [Sorghum bicolor]|uniref:Uncharacterized protein n=1 Tax=Sorghum bicolor TaxID=4558 RepID=A0A921Q1Z8_SORBI|nr:hypothetical protein BDA96_10G002800 [Sorghum bicolor]